MAAFRVQEELILSRISPVCLTESGPVITQTDDFIDNSRVNTTLTVQAQRPGTGCKVWIITRIDQDGLWGILKFNSVRFPDAGR